MPRQQSTSAAASTTAVIATGQSEAANADHAYRYWVGVASAVICGICFGIAPGIVSIYLPFYSRMKDCAAHTEQDVCLRAPNANCEWVDATCRFSDWRVVDCQAYNGNPTRCANPGSSSSPATVFVATPPLATTTTVAAATPSPPPLPSISRPTWHAPIWIGDGALARHAHAAAAEGVIGGGSTSAAAVGLTVTDETAVSSSSSVCSYDYDTQTCAHVAGYDDTRTGIYAAASTALGAVVPLAVDAVRKRYGLPAAFATCAAVALLSNILATWSLATDAFMVMVTARLIYGGIAYAIMGLSMSYVEITAPAATPAAGTALNFAVNLTYLLLDTYGVYAPKLSANYFWLLEGLHSFQWVITIAVVVFIPVVIGVLKQPPPPSVAPVEAAHAKEIELSTTEKSPFPQADGMMMVMPPFPLFSPLDITSCGSDASAAPSGTTTAPTQSPADTPQPQHLIACPPCLVVSPVAVGSPTDNNDGGCSGKHVSFAAVPPQVIVLTAASSVAPSPTHPTTPACEKKSSGASTHTAATRTESDELAAVSSGPSSASSPPEPSQSAGVEGKMDSRSADCGTRDIVSTGAAAEFEIVEGSPPVEVETEAEATSFVEDLHALVTTYRMPFLRGILVASFENGCGIAAVTNFAPLLLQSSGFDPMQGNLLCGLAYVIGAALGAPIERRFSVRGRAFTGAFVMSASALVIGLSILPPVDFGLLTVVGLIAWIGALSAVYAPVYYYCSVKLFPPRCQATASATMLMASAFWTLVESAVFPSVVTALSGGDGGDKRWGRGLTFIAFAVLGTGLSALLVKTFKTWDEVVAEEKQKKHNVVASTAGPPAVVCCAGARAI